MRLIDANKIKEELKLKELSHIIKQEEYLDYVLNEWKTRVIELGGYNVIEEIENAPTVEAIPIEWFKKWGEKHKNDPCYCNFVTDEILADWKKENEKQTMG